MKRLKHYLCSTRDPRHGDPLTAAGGCAADYTLFLAVLAALGASLVLARMVNYGPGLVGADSLHYVTTAQSLLAGKGFINGMGSLYTLWPPLYPLALAAAALLTGFDPLDVAGPLNAAIFGLTVFIQGRWLRRRLESRFLAAWAACVLALSILPLGDAAAWALSEPLFMLLAMLALIEAEKYLSEGKRRSLAAAAAYGALACQARYIGVAVPFFTGLLLLCRAGGGCKQRTQDAAVVWLAAGLPAALWMLRNYLLVGFFGGFRHPHDYPLPEVLRDIGAILWRWLSFELLMIGLQPPELLSLPPRPRYDYLKQSTGGLQPPELFSLDGGVWAAALAAAGWVLLRFPWKKQTLAAWRPLWIFGGFALIYLALFAAFTVLGHSDGLLRPRYVAPAYIPLLFAAAFALDRLGRAGRGSRESAGRRAAGRLAAAAVAAALCLWTAGQAAPHARRIVRANAGEQDGDVAPSISDDLRWVETMRYVKANPLDGAVYVKGFPLLLSMCNPGAAYLDLRDSMDIVLQEEGIAAAAAEREQLQAKLAAAPDGAWLVWSKNAQLDNLVGLGEAWLRVLPMLDPVADLADGLIYRVRRDAAPRANPYRAALRAAVGEPRVNESRVGKSGGFDVSWRGGELVYIKESCSAEEVRARFLLHVYPADAADLPAARRRGGYAFDNLSFYFPEYGVVADGACAALYPLPDYAIERIETGQIESAQGAAWKTTLCPERTVESGE